MKLSEHNPSLLFKQKTKTVNSDSYAVVKTDYQTLIYIKPTTNTFTLTVPTDIAFNFSCVLFFDVSDSTTLTVTTSLTLFPTTTSFVLNYSEYFGLQKISTALHIARQLTAAQVNQLVIDNAVGTLPATTDQLPEGAYQYMTSTRTDAIINPLITAFQNRLNALNFALYSQNISTLQNYTQLLAGAPINSTEFLTDAIPIVSDKFPSLFVQSEEDLNNSTVTIYPYGSNVPLGTAVVEIQEAYEGIDFFVDLRSFYANNLFTDGNLYTAQFDENNILLFKSQVSKIFLFEFGWDPVVSGYNMDVDLYCKAYDVSDTLIFEIYYNELYTPSRSIYYWRDNVTGTGTNPDEIIWVDFSKIESNIVKIDYVLNIFQGELRGLSFDDIINGQGRLFYESDPDNAMVFTPSQLPPTGTNAIIARSTLTNSVWGHQLLI